MQSNQLFEEQVLKNCVIIKEDVDKLSAEEFTMLRRCGLGAQHVRDAIRHAKHYVTFNKE